MISSELSPLPALSELPQTLSLQDVLRHLGLDYAAANLDAASGKAIARNDSPVGLIDYLMREELRVQTERKTQMAIKRSATGTAIIATRLPEELREALRSGDSVAVSDALQAWQPVVDLPFDQANVDRTIADFGRCVDSIEDAEFAPPSLEEIGQPRGMRRRKSYREATAAKESAGPTFAQSDCQNCDARFSCPSYRALPREKPGRGRRLETAKANPATNYQQELDDWIDVNLTDDTQ
jgi:hypothetical protein